MNQPHSGLIRLIAVFKLFKAASLIVVGFGILRLIHKDVGEQLEHWVAMCGFDPGSRLISHAIEKAAHLSPHKFREFSIVSFIYAGLFLTEGIGLWLMKRWAEWFTVIITSSLVPVEIYEIVHHPTAIKMLVLVINIAVVAYLPYRIKSESHSSPKNVMRRMARPLHNR
ncbi:DUF2127 domain-containing protein [Telmatobacter sp. DSM 110680]|uniref:DUF2127 domain-containing protein n=1 Tax=Telmatobacter sp. DSM 110680 TaxID=3036704 RepID=A0AAU7DDC1_9BACT